MAIGGGSPSPVVSCSLTRSLIHSFARSLARSLSCQSVHHHRRHSARRFSLSLASAAFAITAAATTSAACAALIAISCRRQHRHHPPPRPGQTQDPARRRYRRLATRAPGRPSCSSSHYSPSIPFRHSQCRIRM